jgi:hypothetical protein
MLVDVVVGYRIREMPNVSTKFRSISSESFLGLPFCAIRVVVHLEYLYHVVETEGGKRRRKG